MAFSSGITAALAIAGVMACLFLLCLLVFVLVTWVIMTVFVKASHRLNRNTRPEIIPLQPDQFPDPVGPLFASAAEDLARLGFEHRACLAWQRFLANSSTYMAVFLNPSCGDEAAAVISLRWLDRRRLRSIRRLEFRTSLDDGTALITDNQGVVGLSDSLPLGVVQRFPLMADPVLLYEAHQRVMLERCGHVRARPEHPGDSSGYAARAEQDLLARLEEQIRMGRMYLNAKTGFFRPTWKGAASYSWGELSIVKSVRRRTANQKARRQLSQLNLPTRYGRMAEQLWHDSSGSGQTTGIPMFCPSCDYNLTGLAAPRCPECGRNLSSFELRDRVERTLHPVARNELIRMLAEPIVLFGGCLLIGQGIIAIGKWLLPVYADKLREFAVVGVFSVGGFAAILSYYASLEAGRRLAVNRALKRGFASSGTKDRLFVALMAGAFCGLALAAGCVLVKILWLS
jgi:hypothetical protein